MDYKKEIKRIKKRQRNVQLIVYGFGIVIIFPWLIAGLFTFYMPMLMKLFLK